MKALKIKKLALKSALITLATLSPLSIILTFSCSQNVSSETGKNDEISSPGGGSNSGGSNSGGTTNPEPSPGSPEPGGPTNPGNGNENNGDQNKPLQINSNINRMPNPTTFFTTTSKILKRDVERKVNKEVYSTKILEQYPTFKYPGWQLNYEGKTNGKPNHIQNINGTEVNGMQLVYNERSDMSIQQNGQEVFLTYADSRFILQEIANDRLKVHPAAALWYEQEIDPKVKAIEKGFALNSAISGVSHLGLYAAPGEVVTMTFDLGTLNKMKAQGINDFKIILNDSFWNNFKPGNTGQISTRYPYVRTEFVINVNQVINNQGVFKFGSPFGGSISVRVGKRLKAANSSVVYPSYEPFRFKVSGALETIYYNHTQTTKADWDDQIARAKAGQITAPAMQFDFAFGQVTFASTGKNQFARANLADIAYPFDVMERWTEFMFVSEFFSGRDLDNAIKIWFQFNDDIQNGAAGLGGNGNLQGPLSWAKQAFLDGLVKDGIDNWLIGKQWGTFHEINHNFNKDQVLFSRRDHQETNQVSMVGLSLLSDQGRWRNLYNGDGNWSRNHGSWNRFANAWTVNQRLAIENFQRTEPGKKIPYELQYLLLSTFGTYNFLDYTRDDLINDPNTRPGWTGFSEIERLSRWFQLDLWPAMRGVGNWFNELEDKAWPTDDANLSDAQRAVTTELQKFKAIDFMGNLFATGTYLWSEKQKDFVYTNDTQAPIDVAAGADYVFDFAKGINSANPDLEWQDLQFSNQSKLGGTLKTDPANNKILIYSPPANAVGQTDEFDMAISNFSFKNNKPMPPNYIDKYVWKVKIRLVGNMPAISIYNDKFVPNNVNAAGKFKEDFAYLKNPANIKATLASDPRAGILAEPEEPNALDSLKNKWTRAKISFDFLAPETGSYDFQIKGFGWAFLVDRDNPETILWENNAANKPSATAWSPTMFTKQLNAGQHFKVDLYVTAKIGTTRIDMQAIVNDKVISVFDNSVLPWANQIIDQPRKLITESQYQYQFRRLDMNAFQSAIGGIKQSPVINQISKGPNNNSNYKFKVIDQPGYQTPAGTPNQNSSADQRLAQKDKSFFEKWGGSAAANQALQFSIETTFTTATDIGAIRFGNRQASNEMEARPTEITIKDQDQKVLYQGLYGGQFNDRMQETTVINVVGKQISKLTFEFKNDVFFRAPDATEMAKGKITGIYLNSIEFTEQQIFKVNRTIATNDPKINYYGSSWHNVLNDPDVNISQVNGQAVQSLKKDEYLEFNLLAAGFDLVGQKLPAGAQFALYINDEQIGQYDTNHGFRLDGQVLATYRNPDSKQWMKIKIVNLTDASLTLDYFQTYGLIVQTKALEIN